ncbi:MAG: zinc transporter [Pseudomonadota bacterium]
MHDDHSHHHDHADHHDHHHHAPPQEVPLDSLIVGRGLTLRRQGRLVLDHVDAHVAPREIVTLIGPNGAGKTTLARVLLGLEKADSGSIERRPDLRIGYVPQRFNVDASIPLTVRRFLALARGADTATIDKQLAEVGGTRLMDQQMIHLSGGETQRVLLARALMRDPQLIVLDEPTRGVDYEGEAEFYDLIARLRTNRGCGILLISHDLHVVMARSDRVLCLNRHICCQGQPSSVAVAPEFQKLFGPTQAQNLGIYVHHHDHAHGPDGRPITPSGT